MSARYDFHVHTAFSGDCDDPMDKMAQSAIEKGLSGMCFTDHMDIDFPGDIDFILDISSYKEKYDELKQRYMHEHPHFEMYFGMELGLQPHLADKHRELLKENSFDFIIASSHLVDGSDPYYESFFEGRKEEEAYRRYFESILENLECFDDFDVYGHLDYIVRYGSNKDKYYSYEKYKDIIDAILKKIISMGKGIELNTGGLFRGMSEPNPSYDIVRAYRQFGGEVITIGSDAHDAKGIAHGFDKAFEILKKAGFDSYCIFKHRERYFEKIV